MIPLGDIPDPPGGWQPPARLSWIPDDRVGDHQHLDPPFPASPSAHQSRLCLGGRVTREMLFGPNKTRMSFGLFSEALERGRWGRGGEKEAKGGGRMDKDPLLSQMLDARTFITMETKAPPCRLSRRWQRGWELVSAYPASNGGRGREKGTPPHPSPLEHPPLSSGLCWEAGIGFLAGTMLGAGGHGWAFPQPYSLAPLRIWTPWAGGATGLGDSIRLTRRAADGCCPRPSGHRGAQGIVSVRRGRHPAGRQWGMGTAHTLGSKLRGKGKGGGGEVRRKGGSLPHRVSSRGSSP